jgi:PAS domain S-box-containing protein
MKNQSAPHPHYMFWFAVLGFVLGLLGVIVATVIGVLMAGLPITLNNLVRTNLTNPLLWLFDTTPFVLAVLLGFAGGRQNKLVQLQYYNRATTHRHSAEIEHLSSQLADSEKARQGLELSLQQQSNEYQQLQSSMDDLGQKSQEIETVISRGKKQWEATFDSVQDMIVLVALDGTIARCNRATSEKFNLDYSQIIGKPFRELVHEERIAGETGPLPSRQPETRITGLEGWYEISSSPLDLEVDQPGKIYVVRDVTERKQAALNLQFQKQYYESLVKNSPIAIVTLKMDHTVVECNPAFEKLFGYQASEVLGKELDSFISPTELVEETRKYTETVGQGEMVHEFTRRKRKDGMYVDVELFGIPVIVRSRQIGVLALYHDISDLVRAREEEALKTYKIEKIEGIGPVYGEKLAAVGVVTTRDLLKTAATRKGRDELAVQTGIGERAAAAQSRELARQHAPGQRGAAPGAPPAIPHGSLSLD